jgi:hypothetical protein
MKFSYLFLSILSLVYSKESCKDIMKQENCVSFSVGQGTGCSWMCEYCQNELGTSNYYFTDGVCTYEEGGCTGSPQVGVTYTCCSN